MSLKNIIKNNSNLLDLECNELIAQTFSVNDLDTNTLKTNNIIEKTPTFGVSIESNLYVDNIYEFSGLHSVAFPNYIKTDYIEGETASEVKIDTIKATDIIESVTNQHVKIQKSKCYSLTEEFVRYRCDFNNVNATAPYKRGSNFVSTNAGSLDYVPSLSGDLFIIPQAGVYSFNCSVYNEDSISPTPAGAFFALRFTNITTNEVLACNICKVENQGANGDFVMSCCFVGYLDASVNIEIGMRQANSPGEPTHLFKGTIIISRLK